MSAVGNRDAVLLHTDDNVATALRVLSAGEAVVVACPGGSLTIMTREDVALCHKVATVDIGRGARVRKYGEVIGVASTDIAAGALVHIHNLRSLRAQGGDAGGR